MSQKCNSPSVQLYATNVVTVNATSSCFPRMSNFLRKPRKGHDHYHQFPYRKSVVRWVFCLCKLYFPLIGQSFDMNDISAIPIIGCVCLYFDRKKFIENAKFVPTICHVIPIYSFLLQEAFALTNKNHYPMIHQQLCATLY